MNKRQIVEAFAQAVAEFDIPRVGELMHPDIISRFPQSGETIRGRENYMAMLANYPGAPKAEISSVKGDAKTAMVPSSMPFAKPTVTVFGGDQFIVEGVATYPNGEMFNIILVLRLQGQQVIEETAYFATAFDPPEWRRSFVEVQ